MLKKNLVFLILLLIISPFVINAQSVEETLIKLSGIAAQKYIEPAMTGFGSNLNSGWVNQVPQAKMFGFDLNIKIVGMGTFLNDKAKTFNAASKFRFSSDQADHILSSYASDPNYPALKQAFLAQEWDVAFSGPTIIGKESENLKITFPGGNVGGVNVAPYVETVGAVKGLLDELTILPTGVPQITVGTVMGTAFSLRYLPKMNIDKLGDFTFSGFGLIHNPAVWFSNPLPVDIGIGFFTQKLKIGSMIESTATQYGVYVSKTIGTIIAIVPYAGLTIESSKTTVNYNFDYSTYINGALITAKDKINFEMEGENSSALLVGATIKLIVVNLNIDYKMAKYNTLSAGVSFGL